MDPNEPQQKAILAIESRILARADKAEKAEVVEPIDKPVVTAEITEQPPQVTPVADAAPVKDEDSDDGEEDDHEDSADSNGDEATAPRKQSRREQRRFNKLTREKYEALRERDAAALKAQMLEQYYQQQMQAQAPPQHAQTPQAPPGKPTLEAFGYDQDAYQEARDKWVMDQAKQSIRQEIEQEQSQRQMQEQGTRFNQRVAELEKEMPGAWQRATSASLQTTPIMEQIIFRSEIGPKVGVYLADHLDEANAIARLHPMDQAVAMGRIEALVKAAPPALPPRPQTTVSRAPAPPSGLPSGGSLASKPADKMTFQDHVQRVEELRKARQGR